MLCKLNQMPWCVCFNAFNYLIIWKSYFCGRIVFNIAHFIGSTTNTHIWMCEKSVFFLLLFKSRRNRWRKCNLWMWTAARNGSNLSIIESYEALNFIVLDLFLAVNNFFVFASYLYRYTVYSVHGKSIHISRRLNTEFLSLPLVFVTKYASRLNITLICERRQVHTQTHWISICVHISSFVLYSMGCGTRCVPK